MIDLQKSDEFRIKGKNILLIAHSDADGHIIAEQSRRNLLADGAAACRIFIDPKRTGSYRFWRNGLKKTELDGHDMVFFLDLMFSPNRAIEDAQSIKALADRKSDIEFVIIDHHACDAAEILLRGSSVRLTLTNSVYMCCYGPSSEIMLVAAICDKDEKPVKARIASEHRRLAQGVSRAAADVFGLCGSRLSRLLANDRWEVIQQLADEPASLHRLVRGRRPFNAPSSPGLNEARRLADQLGVPER